MKYRVVVSAEAESDLDAITDYIAESSGVDPAVEIEERLLVAVESLAEDPERGRVVPALQRQGVTAYRELIDAPWRVMYRVVGKQVRVVAIVDGRRDAADLLWERLRRER
jgi:plasmid stabilization system protein ParE